MRGEKRFAGTAYFVLSWRISAIQLLYRQQEDLLKTLILFVGNVILLSPQIISL